MATENQCHCAQAQEEDLYPRLKEIITEHKGRSEDLIMVLHKAQNLFGYLPRKVQEMVAEGLDLSLNEVYGVVTFYNFFSTFPQGRHSVKVCLGTACYVRGSQKILEKTEKSWASRPAKRRKTEGILSMWSAASGHAGLPLPCSSTKTCMDV